MWNRNKNKLGNTKVDYDGYSFSSKLEASVYQLLKLRQKSGWFVKIECQVQIDICGPPGHVCDSKKRIYYKPDFKCTCADGTYLFVEAKGYPNETWPLKLRLFRHNGPAPLEIWGGNYRNPSLIETVFPKQS